jgi:hypothetical protein
MATIYTRSAVRLFNFPLIVFAFMALTASAFALPTMLNSIPTTDIVPNGTGMLIEGFYTYDYKNTAVASSSSMVHCLEFGYRNVEFGYDGVADKDFEDGGLYPSSFNFKWRLFNQDEKNPVALAVGAFFLGAKSVPGLEGIAYEPSPYFVLGRTVKGVRYSLGYQTALFGYKRVDADPVTGDFVSRNNGVILGVDGTIVKSKKHPLKLWLDYYGGPAANYGIGLHQPINDKFAWTCSYYIPTRDTLPVSGDESPKQLWAEITYSFKVK